MTIYTPPDRDVARIDEGKTRRRIPTWLKVLLFFLAVTAVAVVYGFTNGLTYNHSIVAKSTPLIAIAATQTPDLASLAIMNATATAANSDAERHDASSENLQKNEAIVADSLSQATATAASSQLAMVSTSHAISANSQLNAANATATIQQVQVNADSTVIASRAVLEQKRLEVASKELDAQQQAAATRRGNNTKLQANVGMGLSLIGMIAAFAYVLTHNDPFFAGLARIKQRVSSGKWLRMTNNASAPIDPLEEVVVDIEEEEDAADPTESQPDMHITVHDEVVEGEFEPADSSAVQVTPRPQQTHHTFTLQYGDKTIEMRWPIAINAKMWELCDRLCRTGKFSKRERVPLTESEYKTLHGIWLDAGLITQEPSQSVVFTEIGEAFYRSYVRPTPLPNPLDQLVA